MQKKSLAAMTAVGLVAAIAIPTLAFGNARSNLGSFNFQQVAQTPHLARLTGANEVPPQIGDGDGLGAAAITFDIINSTPSTGAEVCWDLSYSNLTGTPTAARIYKGASGVGGTDSIDLFTSIYALGASSATGCIAADPTAVQLILDNPAGYHVNIFTTDHPTGAIRGQLSAGPPPAGEAHFLAVPLRAYDSRANAGPKIAALETRTISLASGKDAAGASFIAVPPGATAALVTLTVTETVGPGGFLKLYNAGIAEPATSSINWAGTNQNVAVSTQVSVDASGQVKVTGGANSTHFVIDVVGFTF
jgi:hypothetical protein